MRKRLTRRGALGEAQINPAAFDPYIGKAMQEMRILERLCELEEKVEIDSWIDVKDKLPGEYETVLAHLEDGFMAVIDFFEDFVLWQDSGEVTHWKPLPEPPKTKEETA